MNRDAFGTLFAAAAVALGIVGIFTRPFLYVPIGLLCMLVSVKLSADRRFTAPALALLTVCALAGTAIAAGFTKPLY